MGRQLTVYLAGPITGCSYGGCTDWRKAITQELGDDFICLSPMRSKPYLAGVEEIGKTYDGANGLKKVLSGSRGIMTRDHWDCAKSDVILSVFKGAEIISIGTVMECAFAFCYRKPHISVMEPGNMHEHPMVEESITHRVYELEDAVTVLRALL